ncbi:hypothetical protein MKP05_20735 [Halomonas sp. EGI 63088]|uniref:Glycosyl transferase family 1 domain-containing protein n=1 Tax=Halomonas flagellata TaxID=2920385 RepID=A0ABS9S093_9GAMM|nr:hypothetical protein [Halomonas flagellata]MCH4565528.1 hypothetical protein [Halomonas flagellata]
MNGLLVEPRGLANAMLAMIDAEDTVVEAMGRASLERVARQYDVQRVNRRLLEITDL